MANVPLWTMEIVTVVPGVPTVPLSMRAVTTAFGTMDIAFVKFTSISTVDPTP